MPSDRLKPTQRPAIPRRALCVMITVLLAVGFAAGCFLPAAVAVDVKKLVDGRHPNPQFPELCGNGACDTHRFETCAQCPADCGRCETGEPDLVTLTPEVGSAKRWVSIFGLRLGAVQRLWLVHPSQGRTSLLHRRRGTALQVHIPANSKGGVLHIQVGGKVRTTELRYTVQAP